jgi:hypothetical protein
LGRGADSASEALTLYENTINATEFEGRKRDSQEFRNWKEKHEDRLKNRDFQSSVQLHLQYLGLLLQQALDDSNKEKDPKEPVNPALRAGWLAYFDTLKQNDTAFRDNPKMFEELIFKNDAVPNSPFVKLYQLERFGKAFNDRTKPGDINDVSDKWIFPLLRKSKDRIILNLWDTRISLAKEDSERPGTDDAKIRFENLAGPALRWRRAKDLLTFDQPAAWAEMLVLVKTYKTHPNADEWITELRNLTK